MLTAILSNVAAVAIVTALPSTAGSLLVEFDRLIDSSSRTAPRNGMHFKIWAFYGAIAVGVWLFQAAFPGV